MLPRLAIDTSYFSGYKTGPVKPPWRWKGQCFWESQQWQSFNFSWGFNSLLEEWTDWHMDNSSAKFLYCEANQFHMQQHQFQNPFSILPLILRQCRQCRLLVSGHLLSCRCCFPRLCIPCHFDGLVYCQEMTCSHLPVPAEWLGISAKTIAF